MVPEIMNAIISISNGTAQASVRNNDINKISWENGTTPISKADIEAKMVELQAEYDAQEYARNRATEYPALAEQLDEIFHNGIDSWKAVIKVTKDKYPKG
tara:strand:- start:1733 stop:2032 length:300 start_codon:yes stop_codon:yes gene_type:complete